MPEPAAERIGEVGYINPELRHALVSVYNPTLLNVGQDPDFVQVALTIEGAVELRAELNAFLMRHGVALN